jgi:hypothetical protein
MMMKRILWQCSRKPNSEIKRRERAAHTKEEKMKLKIKIGLLAVACIVLLSGCSNSEPKFVDKIDKKQIIKVNDKCLIGYLVPQEKRITAIAGEYVETVDSSGFVWWYEKKDIAVCFNR